MANNMEQIYPRMLFSITKPDDGKKLEEIFEEFDVPIRYQFRGKGTATSEMLDIFGLGGTTRIVTVGIVSKYRVSELFDVMRDRLFYHQRGGGIAFCIPINGLQSGISRVLSGNAQEAIKKSELDGSDNNMTQTSGKKEYVAILASVEAGFCDDAVDAAREAGARGGTILKGFRKTSEETSKNLGISVHDEQELILIVTNKEKKNDIMSAISKVCGLGTESHGFVFSMPVDDTMGLNS